MSKSQYVKDLVTSLRSLADSIEAYVSAEEAVPVKQQVKRDDPAKPEVEQPTLEEVRAAMAAKNKNGHREEVKAILHNFGANKLTSLDPQHYSEVLKEVEAIR